MIILTDEDADFIKVAVGMFSVGYVKSSNFIINALIDQVQESGVKNTDSLFKETVGPIASFYTARGKNASAMLDRVAKLLDEGSVIE